MAIDSGATEKSESGRSVMLDAGWKRQVPRIMTAHFIISARSSVINGKHDISSARGKRRNKMYFKRAVRGARSPNETSRQLGHIVDDEVQAMFCGGGWKVWCDAVERKATGGGKWAPLQARALTGKTPRLACAQLRSGNSPRALLCSLSRLVLFPLFALSLTHSLSRFPVQLTAQPVLLRLTPPWRHFKVQYRRCSLKPKT